MERFAWKGQIKAGKIDEYKKRHDEIWPQLKQLLKDAGISNYTIWTDGELLFGYYECEKGVAYAESVQTSSPLVDKWNEYMDDILIFEKQSVSDAQPKLQQVFCLE